MAALHEREGGAIVPDATAPRAAAPDAAVQEATPQSTARAAAPEAAPPASRAWRVALEHIESRLLSGELRPGDHLPPERQLATDVGVARSSVREAIRVLEVLGLVRTATGSGPNAGAIIVASPDGGMSAVMRLHVAAQGFPVADVVEARLVVEPAIAAHLARTRARAANGGNAAEGERGGGAVNLQRASALLDAMDVPDLEPAEFLALDARFHVALAEASGNTVLSATMAGLRDSIEGYVLQAVPNLPSWWATSARLRAEHRGILQAIRDGDATDAARRVHAHVAGYAAESRLTNEPSKS
ncbi:FadR/GntR family transcriptional regulator [Humibacter sp.]|uniref:FadR/GntR family transcriptional regulator n=1 Tax=Humibacter sp. TaxID=1940291 RepID=UPI003F7FF761